jgi:outer membrane protein TolC
MEILLMNKSYHAIILSGLITSFSVVNISLAAEKITFNEAIDFAIKNNLEVQASYEEYKASEYDKKIARGNFLPKLSIGMSYEKVENENNIGFTNANDGYSASLTLTQNLFNGFADLAGLKIADSNIMTSEANLQESKSQISYDLKNAVANYFYAKDSLVLSKDIRKRREDNLRMVELRFENGRENKGSVLLSKAYLEQSKLDLIRAENAMRVSLTFLRRVLNLPDDSEVEITTIPEVMEVTNDPNYNALIALTPEAKRFRASLNNAGATLQADNAGFYPTWDINASIGKTGETFFPDENRRFTASTTLSWAIFNGGKDFYTYNASKLLVKAAEKRLENQNLELKRQLVTNYTALVEAIAFVRVSSAFLEAAKVRSEIARSKYNNGLTNFDDWDIIENDLITRQKDYTQRVRDRLIAEASWEKAQGTGVIP